MRNPFVAYARTKSGNRTADQCLCFRCIDGTIPLPPKYKISSLRLSSAADSPFLSDLVGNPEYRFFHNEAHIQ